MGVFGDSITAGNFLGRGYVSFIRKELRRRFPERGIEVLNAGVSGDRVTELERRIERDVIAKNPTHVVIYIGINDVWHWENGAGTPLERYREGLENLVGRIQQAKAIPILCTPSVIGELKNRQNKFDVLLDQHATAVREVAAKYGLALCDLRKAFQEYLEQNNHDNHAYGVLTSDGVHLNHQGNELVARIIMEVFA